MEKLQFEIGQDFVTNGGTRLLCYEVSERFAFLAPVEVEDNKVVVKVAETLIYRREIEGDELSAIETISFDMDKEKEEEEKAE